MRKKAILIALAATLCAAMMFHANGCSGHDEPLAELDHIHESFKESAYKISHLADFFDALARFDLENGMFLEDVRAAVEKSRSEADEIDDDLKELRAYDYDGEMSKLGEDIAEYCDQAGAALLEFGEMYQPLLDLLQTMEPALREEAVLTQLDVPESDEEFVRRILSLEEALSRTLSDLPQVHVPESLEKYKVLMEQVFASLKKMADDLMALAGGQAIDFKMDDNEDMQQLQTILGLHDPLLQATRESLKVNHLDPCMQKVEDDFYDLFLERGSRDEGER